MIGALTRSFRHGIHPQGHKEDTEHLAVERMPFVDRYHMPLSQHAGAPARPVVRVGERVRRGQVIAEPAGFVSTTLHSPVTGTVVALAPAHHPNGRLVDAVEIEADPFATQRLGDGPPKGDKWEVPPKGDTWKVPPKEDKWEVPPKGDKRKVPWRQLSNDDFVAHVQQAGLVGMGGAAFPCHVKYQLPAGRRVRRLVVNGCECEPYLTADHRTMVERPDAVLRGIEILATHLAVEEVTVGVELNKADAIRGLEQAIAAPGLGIPVRVVPLRVKYPQGAEKMLIEAIYGVEVPAGGLPLDVETLVNNVGTMAAIADYFDRGWPLVERVVTVAGPGVERPANLRVPVGTPVRAVFDHCGGLKPETREVVMGGPMMGMPLASLDVPVLKGTSGLLAFTEAEARLATEYTCIRCGRCVESCPQFLNPSRLARLARAGRFEEMERYFATDCMECGSCSYACPSGIPIVQLIRVGKQAIRKANGP